MSNRHHLFYFLFSIVICLARSYDIYTATRIVVTFHTREQANATYEVGNFTVVNQYGRRLVLDLGREVDLSVDEPMIKNMIGKEVVKFVETDDIVSSDEDPNFAWHLVNSEPFSTKAENIWKLTNGTPDIRVAVLDSGIPIVARGAFLNLDPGYDFITNTITSNDGDGRDPDPTDPGPAGSTQCTTSIWHGLGVSSTIASSHNSTKGLGAKGIAPNVTIIPIRTMGPCNSGSSTDVAAGILYAAGGYITGIGYIPRPAKIISISTGAQNNCPDYMQQAITEAVSLGAIIFASAGNTKNNVTTRFPANCVGVISVGASRRDGALASYSNTWSDMIAPGGDSYDFGVPTLGVSYTGELTVRPSTGTSFATPLAAGAMALVLSICKNIVNVYQFVDMFDTKAQKTRKGIQLNMEMLSIPEACSGMTSTCPLHKLTNTTSSNCTSCASENGYRNRCLAWNAAICEKCPAGKYLQKNGTASRCISCPIGKFSNVSDSSACMNCQPGTYIDKERQTACKECILCNAEGYYTTCTTTASGSCALCPMGTFSNLTTYHTECKTCQTGTYASSVGSTECLACQTCLSPGLYKSGCNATSAGYCAACTNTL